MKNKIILLALLAISAIAISCSDEVVIDEYHDLPTGLWHIDSLATFEFYVEDTTVDYSISYDVRYAAQYPYYNLYVTYYLEDSMKNPQSSKLQNLQLFDKKTGEPLGDGMGDLFDRSILIDEKHRFKVAGKHYFQIKQFMRMDELPGVLSFGLKIHKTTLED